jgi:hypothetical protein
MQPLEDAVDPIVDRTGFSGVVRVDRSGSIELAKRTGSPIAATRSPTFSARRLWLVIH